MVRASVLRLITLDVTDTLLRFRRPVFETYFDVATREFELKIESSQKIRQSFINAYTSVDLKNPNFGVNTQKGDRAWWHEVVKQTFEAILRKDECNARTLAALSTRLYNYYGTSEAYEIYNDALSFLHHLHQKHPETRLGVITNNDHRIVDVLQSLGILPMLKICIYSQNAGHTKPEVAIFEKALREADIGEPTLALHVGDNVEKDYVAAMRAGFNALWINRDNKQSQSVPKGHVCSDFDQVLERIRHLLP